MPVSMFKQVTLTTAPELIRVLYFAVCLDRYFNRSINPLPSP